ncbi:MAG: FHA domain-containing protein [Planctomycetales bacterium]
MPLSIETQLQPRAHAAIRHMLWIDGVGAFLVCGGDQVTIGGPPRGDDDADVPLLADLARRHATFIRTSGGAWLLEGDATVRLDGKLIDRRAALRDGSEIALLRAGAPSRWAVRLRFRVPSALSATARLEFESDHRPATSVDAVVLMDQNCLLGPGPDCHVRCPDWPATVVLFRRDGAFHVTSRVGCAHQTATRTLEASGSIESAQPNLFADAHTIDDTGRIAPGQIITGPDLCFRLEELA